MDRVPADRLLRHLCWAGIVCFLLISAFDIHVWRADAWQAFDERFVAAKRSALGYPARPVWLYALAFPFVALNFGCMVQLLRGRRRAILPLFATSAAAIAVIPLAAWQGVIYRPVWADILSFAGYAIGGGIATILYFELDKGPATASSAGQYED